MFLYLLVRIFTIILNLFPYSWRVSFFCYLLKLFFENSRRYQKIAEINLSLAFPEKSEGEKREILSRSYNSMAKLIVDVLNLDKVNSNWIRQHVAFPELEACKELLKANQKQGILFLTGHLGSFELIPLSLTEFLQHNGSFVAREFKNKYLDNWWNRLRTTGGNQVIKRKGALRKIVKAFKNGEIVGLLFDQNVTRNHAVFVDWFGKPAATTMAVGFAAVSFEIPIAVIYIKSLPNRNYIINMKICDCSDIYTDTQLDDEMKKIKVTERASNIFQHMVKEYPEGWFWFHRRWKTRPEGEESLYQAS